MPEPATPHIIAIMPAYNEQAHLGQVLSGVRRYLPALVVDDGSTDQTGAIAEAGGAILVRQIPNQGKGAALRAGFRYALEQGYTGVLTLDADGQHDPEEIPAFLNAYNQNQADLIIGERNFSTHPARASHGEYPGALELFLGYRATDPGQSIRLPVDQPPPSRSSVYPAMKTALSSK